jgi:sugar O-acyltransferase (sialic acid O-acetyltransferase NeuD family)
VSVVVVGAGGHAKVIVGLCHAAGIAVRCLVDANPAKHGTAVLGVVVQPQSALSADDDVVIGVGDNRARARLAASLAGHRFVSLVHPRAFVDPSSTLAPGAVVFAGAVVQPDVVVGAHAIINTGATVDHDCRIGAFVHIAPGVHLCGGVVVDEGGFCGVASAVIPGKRVGRYATVGAGGVVVADVADGVTVVGVPARLR